VWSNEPPTSEGSWNQLNLGLKENAILNGLNHGSMVFSWMKQANGAIKSPQKAKTILVNIWSTIWRKYLCFYQHFPLFPFGIKIHLTD